MSCKLQVEWYFLQWVGVLRPLCLCHFTFVCCILLSIRLCPGGVQVGYRDIAEMLLRKGADLCAEDNAGNSTLHYAAKGGHFPTIEWLIEQVGMMNARCVHAKCLKLTTLCIYHHPL